MKNVNSILFILLIVAIVGIIINSYNKNKLEAFLDFNPAEWTNLINTITEQNAKLNTIKDKLNTHTKQDLYNPEITEKYFKLIQKSINDKFGDNSQHIFDLKQDKQDYRLNIINTELNGIIDKINKNNPNEGLDNNLKMIGNPHSGVNLNIHRIKYGDDGTEYNVNDNRYAVYLNGKCLSYDENTKYGLEHCMANKTEQQFRIKNIQSLDDYNKALSNQNDQLRLADSVPLPFHIMSPTKNEKECLDINVNNISVKPCNLSPYQRWNTSNKLGSC